VELRNFENPDRVTISFNGERITEFPPNQENSYAIFFVPREWRDQNEIRVTAERGATRISKSITVRHSSD
jgi:hypothetical protein